MESAKLNNHNVEWHHQIETALLRAYRSARLKAAQTGTSVVNMVDGEIVLEKVLMSDIVGNHSYTAADLANYVNYGILLKDKEAETAKQLAEGTE